MGEPDPDQARPFICLKARFVPKHLSLLALKSTTLSACPVLVQPYVQWTTRSMIPGNDSKTGSTSHFILTSENNTASGSFSSVMEALKLFWMT